MANKAKADAGFLTLKANYRPQADNQDQNILSSKADFQDVLLSSTNRFYSMFACKPQTGTIMHFSDQNNSWLAKLESGKAIFRLRP